MSRAKFDTSRKDTPNRLNVVTVCSEPREGIVRDWDRGRRCYCAMVDGSLASGQVFESRTTTTIFHLGRGPSLLFSLCVGTFGETWVQSRFLGSRKYRKSPQKSRWGSSSVSFIETFTYQSKKSPLLELSNNKKEVE